MKKHLLIAAFLLSLCFICSAQVTDSMSKGLSGYKPIYFITGIGDDQAKLQFSVKYDFFYPFFENIGLYLGYTQLMFWDIYESSYPFRCLDYNPEAFWRFESKKNFLGNVDIPGLDYVQLGLFEHQSNGEEGLESRGWYRCYLQFQASTPFFINFGLNLKVFYIWSKLDNPDMEDYIGNYEAMLFLRIIDENNMELEEIYCKFASGGGIFGFDFSKGYQEIGIKTRPIIARFRPYVQIYHGYGESLIKYNVMSHNSLYNQDFSFRLGLIVE